MQVYHIRELYQSKANLSPQAMLFIVLGHEVPPSILYYVQDRPETKLSSNPATGEYHLTLPSLLLGDLLESYLRQDMLLYTNCYISLLNAAESLAGQKQETTRPEGLSLPLSQTRRESAAKTPFRPEAEVLYN